MRMRVAVAALVLSFALLFALSEANDRARFLSALTRGRSYLLNPPAKHCDIANTNVNEIQGGKFKTLELNNNINRGYAKFGVCFQSIVEGEATAAVTDLGLKGTPGVWFSVAPYASMTVGFGERAIETAVKAWNALLANRNKPAPAPPPDPTWKRVLRWAAPLAVMGGDAAAAAVKSVQDLANDIIQFVFDLVPALCAGGKSGNLGVFTQDPKIAGITAARALSLMCPALGGIAAGGIPAMAAALVTKGLGAVQACATGIIASGIQFANTLLNALEEGNRRIYSDIGWFALSWLELRADPANAQGGKASGKAIAQKLVDKTILRSKEAGFNKYVQTAAKASMAEVQKVYDYGIATAKPGAAIPFQFGQGAMATVDSVNIMIGALWLYEQAGATAAGEARNQFVKLANNLLAWREQKISVQPAFTPAAVNPGEFNRQQLFQIMTPTLQLVFRGTKTWKYYDDYCAPKRLDITTTNWGLFPDRWPPIINAFEKGYADPSALFPITVVPT